MCGEKNVRSYDKSFLEYTFLSLYIQLLESKKKRIKIEKFYLILDSLQKSSFKYN